MKYQRKRNFWAFRSSVKSYHAKFVIIWWSFFVSRKRFFTTVNQKDVFMKPSRGSYRSFNGWLEKKTKLHELVEITRQSSNPDLRRSAKKIIV